MATKPDLWVEWASDEVNNTEPGDVKKALGWENAEAPSSSFFNAILFQLFKYASYVHDAVFVSDSGSALPGVTGNASAENKAGVRGIGGTGGSSGFGVLGEGATNCAGVKGVGGTNGFGGRFEGTGNKNGVSGIGGSTDGTAGVGGSSAATNGYGGFFTGSGTGAGAYATNPGTGPAIRAEGVGGSGLIVTSTAAISAIVATNDSLGAGLEAASDNGVAIVAIGGGNNAGAQFTGGDGGTDGHGAVGISGETAGAAGLKGLASAVNTYGVYAVGHSSGNGEALLAQSNTAAAAIRGNAGTGDGIVGIASQDGYAAVQGDGSSGSAYGVVAKADTTSPVRAALRIIPQNARPSSPQPGDVIINSATNDLEIYLNISGGGWYNFGKTGPLV